MPSVIFHTLGCKLNQAETEKLMYQFIEAGYSVSAGEKGDICVLNTCTVTHIADRKARHFVRLMRKNNPQSILVATGCYAETASEILKKAGADLVIGNIDKGRIVSRIRELMQERKGPSFLRSVSQSSAAAEQAGLQKKVRSFIKIQDGCQHFCSYCVVPLVRKNEYSVSSEDIVSEINKRFDEGYREAILTGTEIGNYVSGNREDLKALIQKILDQTKIPRLHLSSLQPQEISSDLLRFWTNSRLQRHFHLALQSGTDSVLKRMNREYTIEDFQEAVNLIRANLPDVSITTDVMAGFPAETDKEFEDSYGFCRQADFSGIHVFSYSPRPGTTAAKMKAQVDEKVKKARSLRLLALAKQSAKKFRQMLVGKTVDVLFESEISACGGVYTGFTDNYVRVFVKSKEPLTNQILPVKLVKNIEAGLLGELLS